jgi:uncharacterized protein YaeQ
MAAGATLHVVHLVLSDVDRNVYETLEVRLAQHPSESPRYLATRLLAYALAYEEGIGFSKGGVSSRDEPPLAVHDMAGSIRAWIDVGTPTADRLHKAAKACPRVLLFTSADLAYLATERIHRREEIEVWRIDAAFIDALAARLERRTSLELVRNEGRLYATTSAGVIEGEITRVGL